MSTDLTIIRYHRLRSTTAVDGDDKNDEISCWCFNDGGVDIVDADGYDAYDEYNVAAVAAVVADDDEEEEEEEEEGGGGGWWWWCWGWSWWSHQMETFSALLALCAGNSPVTGEFPSQRPVTRSFDVDVFFHMCLNKRLSKLSWGWWYKTPSRSLLRQCNMVRILMFSMIMNMMQVINNEFAATAVTTDANNANSIPSCIWNFTSPKYACCAQ